MEKRLVFYDFETESNHDEIVSRLLQYRFTKDVDSGFSIHKSNESGIYFRHIKKSINIAKIITPFGEEYENKSIDYAVNEAKIRGGVLYLVNPTRAIIPFRNDLLKAFEFRCVIDNKMIDLRSVLSFFKNKDLDINFTDIELTSYGLFKDSQVKMFISSNSDLIVKVRSYVENSSSVLIKIGFHLNYLGGSYYIEVGCKGTVKIKGDFIDERIEDFIIKNILI